MNSGSLLFLGVFFSFALSWCGMIFLPQTQIGRQELTVVQETGQLYPPVRNGLANQGRELYRSLGCVACHTQQVRDNDVPRWGQRFTVAQDYLRDYPVLTGLQRVGPDLSSVGLRNPDANWHLLHLYNPQTKVPGSSMPSYRFLFKKYKVLSEKSPDALKLEDKFAPEAGYEIVPKQEALALVAYIQSLRVDNFLYEAPNPNPPKPKPEVEADAATTNAPAGNTNSPAK